MISSDKAADGRQSNGFWLKRLGVAGFLFFLGKGLLWLIVPAVLVWYRGCTAA